MPREKPTKSNKDPAQPKINLKRQLKKKEKMQVEKLAVHRNEDLCPVNMKRTFLPGNQENTNENEVPFHAHQTSKSDAIA